MECGKCLKSMELMNNSRIATAATLAAVAESSHAFCQVDSSHDWPARAS